MEKSLPNKILNVINFYTQSSLRIKLLIYYMCMSMLIEKLTAQ